MLIATGVLIALVLVVLVGNTARTMQGVGWLPIHPIDIEFPLWMGTWLGIYPTVETLVAQLARLLLRRSAATSPPSGCASATCAGHRRHEEMRERPPQRPTPTAAGEATARAQ